MRENVSWLREFFKEASKKAITCKHSLVASVGFLWTNCMAADIHERVNHGGYTNVEFFMLINLTLVRTEGVEYLPAMFSSC